MVAANLTEAAFDRNIEVYAKYDPDYLGAAARAIDAYFRELGRLVSAPVDKPLRASCVPS